MNETDQRIKELFTKMESDPSLFSKVLEDSLLNSLKESEKTEYLEFKTIFGLLKEDIKKRGLSPLLADKIREAKLSGQDKLVTNSEELLKKGIPLFIERQVLMINILRKMGNKEIKLSKIEANFDKYTLSNFYRTYCELTPKLMSNIIYEIANHLIKEDKLDKDTKRKLTDIKSNFNRNKLMLNDLRNAFLYFDTGSLGLVGLIDKAFLFKDKDGFSLRNKVAHDTTSFSEIDNNLLISEVLKINSFVWAFLLVFYMEDIGEFCIKRDLSQIKDLFNLN